MSNTAAPLTDTDFLDLFFDAIEASFLVPKTAPILSDLPAHMTRDNIATLLVEERGTGYVANIYFKVTPQGQPDMLGTPDATPLPLDLALLEGAALLCLLVTGEQKVPFFSRGKKMICTSSYSFQPSPWTPAWRA